MDNVIKFPDKIKNLNSYRIYAVLESLEDMDAELHATTEFIAGLYNFYEQFKDTEIILDQLSYLEFLVDKHYGAK